jgi:ribosomal protein L40E
MPLRQYYLTLESQMKEKPDMMIMPVLTCKKCGGQSAYKAAKCPKCGRVFEVGWKRGDFEDRCPDAACGHSQIEEDRKRAPEARNARKS